MANVQNCDSYTNLPSSQTYIDRINTVTHLLEQITRILHPGTRKTPLKLSGSVMC
jgi:hypothetical protein